MSLHALPTELIVHIYFYLDPSSHLDFALTSRRIVERSRDTLSHHRTCATLLRSISDEDQVSFIAALETIRADDVAAWHVRRIDIYSDGCAIGKPSSTVPATFRTPSGVGAVGESFHDDLAFSPLLQLPQFHPSTDYQACLELILARCRRIDSLILAKLPAKVTGTSKLLPNDIVKMVCHSCDLPAELQTPGLKSLRSVAIGTQMGREGSGRWTSRHVFVSDFAALLLLPNLRSLAVKGLILGTRPDVDEEILHFYADRLRPGTTNLHHLYFKQANLVGYNRDLREQLFLLLLAAPRDLKSVTFENCQAQAFDRIFDHLADRQGHSLEALIICGEEDQRRTFRRCKVSSPKRLRNFERLRTICIDPEMLLYDSCLLSSDANGRDGMSGKVSSKDDLLQGFRGAVAESTENIVAQGSWKVNVTDSEQPTLTDIEATDDAFCQIVARGHVSKSVANGCSGSKLKAIYLEAFDEDTAQLEAWRRQGRSGTCFPQTVECGKTHGVEVLTRYDVESTKRLFKQVYAGAFGFMDDLPP